MNNNEEGEEEGDDDQSMEETTEEGSNNDQDMYNEEDGEEDGEGEEEDVKETGSRADWNNEDDEDVDSEDNSEDEEANSKDDENRVENKEDQNGEDSNDIEEDEDDADAEGQDGGDDENEMKEQQHPRPPHTQKHRGKEKHRANIFVDDKANGGETSEDSDIHGGEDFTLFINDRENTDTERSRDPGRSLIIILFNSDCLQSGDLEDRQYYWDGLLERAYNHAKDGDRWHTVPIGVVWQSAVSRGLAVPKSVSSQQSEGALPKPSTKPANSNAPQKGNFSQIRENFRQTRLCHWAGALQIKFLGWTPLQRRYTRNGGVAETKISAERIGVDLTADDNQNDDDYMITANDLLWVVPCAAGSEEDAVFDIFNRSSSNITGASAIFNPSHPQRIFIEAASESIARATIDGVSGLFPSQLKLVPYSERRCCMVNFPRHMPLWVRIHDFRRNLADLNGTVAIVVPLLNNMYSNLVEMWTVVTASKDPYEASAPWVYEQFKIDDIKFKINPDELPTIRDIQKFVGCDKIQEYTLNVLFKRIYSANIRPGARVCVTSGEFVGLTGEVVGTACAAATVRLENGIVEPIPLDILHRAFVVGDQVAIATLPWRGVTGWVVNAEEQHVSIWSDKDQKEYHVASNEVEFFSPSFHQTFLLPPQIKRPNISMFDVYQCFKGRTVYITGQHPFKGQRGLIKDTHPDGRVWIQMESMLSGNQTTIFKHTKLSLIDIKTDRHLLPLSGNNVGATRRVIPFAEQSIAAHTSDTATHCDSLLEQIQDLPVVDDTISFPESDPIVLAPNMDPYWLVEACFQHRIKLAHVNDPNHIVQLLGRGSGPGLVEMMLLSCFRGNT
ncbi:hypothetical protein BJ165DRAFT_1408550 [Panaeolus papilionaceus]|nr:hypothetical protein BJ165DRAFT_1408550 [Panaeolus papilionaceus]